MSLANHDSKSSNSRFQRKPSIENNVPEHLFDLELDYESLLKEQIHSRKSERKTIFLQMIVVLTILALNIRFFTMKLCDYKICDLGNFIEMIILGVFSIILLIFTCLKFFCKHQYLTQNLLLGFSVGLLMVFDLLYVSNLTVESGKDLLMSWSAYLKFDLFLFLFMTKNLQRGFSRFFSHLARLVLKMIEFSFLFIGISSKDLISHLIFEASLFLIAVLFLVFENKRPELMLTSEMVKNFISKISLWSQILRRNLLFNCALIKAAPSIEFMEATPGFLKTLSIKANDSNDLFNEVTTKMGLLSELKNNKCKPLGKLKFILEKLAKDQNYLMDKNEKIFYFYIPGESSSQSLKQFQCKIILQSGIFIVIVEEISNALLIHKLKDNNEFKSRLFSCFSHELKTPINGSLPLLESILKDQDQHFEEKCHHLVNCSIQSLKILENTLSLFCDYSQLLSRSMSMNFKEVNLEELFKELETVVSPLMKEKGIKFKIKRMDTFEIIRTDYNRLKEVLLSLLLNSLKFTSSGEIILRINLKEEGSDYLNFEIIDTGAGISELNQVFLRDCLVDKEDLKMHLNPIVPFQGLIITHKLARKLSPSLDKHSKGLRIWSKENERTSISFYVENIGTLNRSRDLIQNQLYKDEIEEIFREPIISSPNLCNFSHENSIKNVSFQEILCVDDDPFNLLSLELMLNRMKKKCVKAFNGVEAIEIVKKKGSFPLIIMDYTMPLLDGIETTKKLKTLMEKQEIADIPIIGCSAISGKNEINNCIQAGMKAFLEKPIKNEDLQRICESFIGKS